MTRGQPLLLVFLKYPEPGKAKTRLAAGVGAERAAALYRGWLDAALQTVQLLRPAVTVVGYFDGGPAGRYVEWDDLVDQWLEQPAGGLGDRLADGFRWGFGQGRPVLAVGTDCPELAARHVDTAVALLHEFDVVFGPATDGGYYLVGARRHVPGFFDGVRWSSPHTLNDHRDRCRQLGLSVALLPELADIDTAADLSAYEARGNGP